MVQTSHSLRTLHRVVTPYHGLPGKHTALQALFAAAELTQANTLVVIDPAGPATSAERVTELIMPICAIRGGVPRPALSAPSARRSAHHAAGPSARASGLRRRARRTARSGILMLGTLRVALPRTEHLASGRGHVCHRSLAAHRSDCQRLDDRADLASGHSRGCADHAAAGRAADPAVVDRARCRRTNHSGARHPTATRLRTWGSDQKKCPSAAEWDHVALAEQARHDISEIQPLLDGVLDPAVLSRLVEDINAAEPRLDDELWVRVVYDVLDASNRDIAGVDDLADMFVPLYMWRAARFMSFTAHEPDDVAQTRLNALCDAFQRLKPALVDGWAVEV